MGDYQKRIEAIREKLDLAKLRAEAKVITQQMSQPSFWANPVLAGEKAKRLAEIQKEINEIEELERFSTLDITGKLEEKLAQLEIRTYFSGKYDSQPAILTIHAGQGGTEAMDWAAMLKRMYLRYFEKKNWEHELVDEVAGDEAGIKSTTLKVNAPCAYGYLKHEAGTHRLVRLSPFNANNLRQTSFALVEILPQPPETGAIAIKDDDLEWQFYRASSQGGQNVQKVSTAVRLLHKPTGIVVTAQAQRSQEQNRKIALELLKVKLWGISQDKAKEEEQRLKGGRTKAAWGTQIRSYILHPYKLVKDLRTNQETSQAELVLEGNLDDFIEAEIRLLS